MYVCILEYFPTGKVTDDNGALMSPDDGLRCDVIDGEFATYYIPVIHVQFCVRTTFSYILLCVCTLYIVYSPCN